MGNFATELSSKFRFDIFMVVSGLMKVKFGHLQTLACVSHDFQVRPCDTRSPSAFCDLAVRFVLVQYSIWSVETFEKKISTKCLGVRDQGHGKEVLEPNFVIEK